MGELDAEGIIYFVLQEKEVKGAEDEFFSSPGVEFLVRDTQAWDLVKLFERVGDKFNRHDGVVVFIGISSGFG